MQGGDLNWYFNNLHYYFRIHLISSNISCVHSLFAVMLLFKVRQNEQYRIDFPWSVFVQSPRVVVVVVVVVLVALRPMSTAMVIAGRSVHLTTLFPGQA